MSEIWRQSGISKYIEVSSLGRARLSVSRQRFRKGHILKPVIKQGYEVIRVYENKKRKHYMLHRLVCEAFNGPPPEKGRHSAHKDGNKTNNIPSNIYWATPQQNIDDRERHGNTMRGAKHYATKLSDNDVIEIKRLIEKGVKGLVIANQFNVSEYVISDIKRGKSWKHVRKTG